MEDKLKNAQAEWEKAKTAFAKVKEAFEKANAEVKAKPKDEKLKKKVEGLAVNLQKAEEKFADCEKAVKEIETEIEKAKEDNPSDSGSDPSVGSGEDGGSQDGKDFENLIRLKVASKTGKPNYFRCGLQFSKQAKEVEVSEDVASVLKEDVWLSVEEIK